MAKTEEKKGKTKKSKPEAKEKKKSPSTGPEYMQSVLEECRTELLGMVDQEVLDKIAPVIKKAAFAAQEFDGRRFVVGYKRAVKVLVLGEDAEKISKGRD